MTPDLGMWTFRREGTAVRLTFDVAGERLFESEEVEATLEVHDELVRRGEGVDVRQLTLDAIGAGRLDPDALYLLPIRYARTFDEQVADTLADTSPGLKHVNQHRYLQGRVRVYLDGVEVTNHCEAFSVVDGEAVVQRRVDGKAVLEWTCACGSTGEGAMPRSVCLVCHEPIAVEVARETLRGVVRVEQKPFGGVA